MHIMHMRLVAGSVAAGSMAAGSAREAAGWAREAVATATAGLG